MKRKSTLAIVFFMLVTSLAFSQEKPDALKHYFNGRDLDNKGRTSEAANEYNAAILICLSELETRPSNMDSYAVYTWSLYRLRKYSETVAVCRQALNIREDARIVETMAEAYFYLDNFDECLKQMQRYIQLAPDGDRISVAYFFEAEIYRNRNHLERAEFLYTVATHLEPSISLWWYRLGSVREALQLRDGAIDAYNRAIKIAPNYNDALNGLRRLQR